MLTRLSIKGFKNLHQTEVFFGPLTCLSGPSGSGKSNLLTAVRFLSLLAGGSLEAALAQISPLADPEERGALLRHKNKAARLEFDLDVLIEPRGDDEQGRDIEATYNHLRYQLGLKWRADKEGPGCFEIEEEHLSPVQAGRGGYPLHFPHANHWRTSLLTEKPSGDTAFIQTGREKAGKVITLVPDRIPAKPVEVLADGLKATVLSSCPSEFPTAWLVAQEMQRWLVGDLREKVPSGQTLAQLAKDNDAAIKADTQAGDDGCLGRLSADLQQLSGEDRRLQINKQGKVVVAAKSGLQLPPAALSAKSRRILNLLVGLEQRTNHHGLFFDDLDQALPAEQAGAVVDRLRAFMGNVDDFYDAANPLRQIVFTANDGHWLHACNLDEWVRFETTSPGNTRADFPRGSWRGAAQPNIKGRPLGKWGEPPETTEPPHADEPLKGVKKRQWDHPLLPFDI